jgi:hypothetical protein
MLAWLGALPAACVSSRNWPSGSAIPAPPETLAVRAVAAGQQWVYEVRNVYNQEIVDRVTETVVSTGPEIRIQRAGEKRGPLDDEIQPTWGRIIQDPHWDPPVRFAEPLPAWPPDFTLGRSSTFRDRYQLLGENGFYLYWNLTMTPAGWESIALPAGEFKVIRFDNFIHFLSNDFSRLESDRMESIWFAPQIGRWVLRRSRGIYFVPDRGGDRYEDYRQWELTAWR